MWKRSFVNSCARHGLKFFIFQTVKKCMRPALSSTPKLFRVSLRMRKRRAFWKSSTPSFSAAVMFIFIFWLKDSGIAVLRYDEAQGEHLPVDRRQDLVVWRSRTCFEKDNSCFWSESWIWPQVCLLWSLSFQCDIQFAFQYGTFI